MTKKNVGIRVSFVWYQGKKWFGTKRSRFGIKEKLGVVVVGDDFFQTSLPKQQKKKQMAMEHYASTRLVRSHESWWSERIL